MGHNTGNMSQHTVIGDHGDHHMHLRYTKTTKTIGKIRQPAEDLQAAGKVVRSRA